MCSSSQARSLLRPLDLQALQLGQRGRVVGALRRDLARREDLADDLLQARADRVLDRLGVLEAPRRSPSRMHVRHSRVGLHDALVVDDRLVELVELALQRRQQPRAAERLLRRLARAAAELAEVAVVDREGERLLRLAAVQRAVVGAPVGLAELRRGSARWDRSAPSPCRRASRSRGRTCARTPRRSCSACRSARPARRPGRWGRTRSPRPSCTPRSRSRPSPAPRRSPGA